MVIRQIIKQILSDDIILKMKNIEALKKNCKMLKRFSGVCSYRQGAYPFGINLIGDISAETGLGQSIRILASIMENAGIPFCIKQINLHGKLEHNDKVWEKKLVDDPLYAINLIHIIPETWAEDYCTMDRKILDYRYNIAYWLWELEEFPNRWVPCIRTVNEIWTPSEFTGNSIRKKTDKPVVTVPYVMDMDGYDIENRDNCNENNKKYKKKKEYYDRKYFDLPTDKFLFITMYDFISISERKNPQAVISAYIKAFPEEKKNVGLIIKVNHIEEKKLTKLKDQLKQYKNIYFITKNLTRTETDSLINAADVLVSLHRAEGFGLPVAEAMALGKPVISTNWSATGEFTDESCACLVNYRLKKLKKSIGPYEKGNYWADADTDHAALFMKKLYEDEKYRNNIGNNAQIYLKKYYNFKSVGNIIESRIKEVYEKNSFY